MKTRHQGTEEDRKRWREYQAQRRAGSAEVRAADAEVRRRYKKKWSPSRLVIRARKRGREAGMEATIKAADLHWPTHCPVLGIPLLYEVPAGERREGPAMPSLDRWDNTKGYVKGNVYVISYRANALKNNATVEEMRAVLRYMEDGVW